MQIIEFLISTIPLAIHFYAQKYWQDDLTTTLEELENDANIPKIKTFDFIVVGGGTAGCVVAGRLSEFFKVLLLEAGGTPPPAASVPYFFPVVSKHPDINYIFKSQPMTNASQATGGIVFNHVGKMLGGSGSHNNNIHNRGNPRDFDNWATITKDNRWTYANVLKYFKKMETFIGKQFENGSDEYYGRDGPITVDTNISPLLPIWFEAGKELGFDVGDSNAFQTESFTPINKAISKGKRSSTYTGYISPYEDTSEKLTVIRYANVSEILLDENNRAYGVAYTRHGIPQIAYASKEIILSAGTFSSPLLLMKSGIGPPETLQAAGISVKVPLRAVGQNLGEHPALILSPFYVNDSSIFQRVGLHDTEKVLQQYQGENPEGIFTNRKDGPQCFVVSSEAEAGWPNIWIEVNPIVAFNGEREILEIYVIVGRPKSRGALELNMTAYKAGIRDDVQLALIDFKLLTHPDDLVTMLEGIKFVFNITENTVAFQKLGIKYGAEPASQCADFEFRSDEYWKCVIRQQAETWDHIVGTCSMGPDDGNSDSSVTDSKFRVRGVQDLRVVDASVIPVVTNANINAPVIMIAEMAVDLLLKIWNPEKIARWSGET